MQLYFYKTKILEEHVQGKAIDLVLLSFQVLYNII